MNKISIIIPVCNEENRIETFLKSLLFEISKISKIDFNILICLNGCQDKSEEIIRNFFRNYNLNLNILFSEKGKLNAQKKCIEKISNNFPILFIDSDTEICKKSIKILIEELKMNKKLIAVGSFPIAKKYKGNNLYYKIMDKILNIRSRFPMAEISKYNVKMYHLLAENDPQNINITKNYEKNSKIFFHGRMFLLKSKKFWSFPKKKGIVGDDSYLPDYIIYNYGKNRIRIRYDSNILFEPIISIKKHYFAYKRIYFDLKNLKEKYPKFKEIRKKSELILDWNYINTLQFKYCICFYLFSLIRKIEKIFFNLSKEKCPKTIWNKSNNKEKVIK